MVYLMLNMKGLLEELLESLKDELIDSIMEVDGKHLSIG